MHLWLLVAGSGLTPALRLSPPAALRVTPPTMQIPDEDVAPVPAKVWASDTQFIDRHSGGAVPFAPIGTAGGTRNTRVALEPSLDARAAMAARNVARPPAQPLIDATNAQPTAQPTAKPPPPSKEEVLNKYIHRNRGSAAAAPIAAAPAVDGAAASAAAAKAAAAKAAASRAAAVSAAAGRATIPGAAAVPPSPAEETVGRVAPIPAKVWASDTEFVDRHCGGAVPFAPPGTAGGTANTRVALEPSLDARAAILARTRGARSKARKLGYATDNPEPPLSP